jgi:hypothetical protein
MTDLTASSLRALKLMDLTTLNDDDTNEKVIALCHQAKTPVGNTAAVCIYPRFIPIARKTLKSRGRRISASQRSLTSRTVTTISRLRWRKPARRLLTAQTKLTWCSRTAR